MCRYRLICSTPVSRSASPDTGEERPKCDVSDLDPDGWLIDQSRQKVRWRTAERDPGVTTAHAGAPHRAGNGDRSRSRACHSHSERSRSDQSTALSEVSAGEISGFADGEDGCAQQRFKRGDSWPPVEADHLRRRRPGTASSIPSRSMTPSDLVDRQFVADRPNRHSDQRGPGSMPLFLTTTGTI